MATQRSSWPFPPGHLVNPGQDLDEPVLAVRVHERVAQPPPALSSRLSPSLQLWAASSGGHSPPWGLVSPPRYNPINLSALPIFPPLPLSLCAAGGLAYGLGSFKWLYLTCIYMNTYMCVYICMYVPICVSTNPPTYTHIHIFMTEYTDHQNADIPPLLIVGSFSSGQSLTPNLGKQFLAESQGLISLAIDYCMHFPFFLHSWAVLFNVYLSPVSVSFSRGSLSHCIPTSTGGFLIFDSMRWYLIVVLICISWQSVMMT